MKLWKWLPGRQAKTHYWKFPLWSFRIWKFGFDAYILKYKPTTLLDWHKDPVKNGKHWRLNIKLKGWATFEVKGKAWWLPLGITVFRPDLYEHRLMVYQYGCTKLSFGFVKFD